MGNASGFGKLRSYEGAAVLQVSDDLLLGAWGAGSPLGRWQWWRTELEAAARRSSNVTVLSVLQMKAGPQDPSVRDQAKRELIRLAPAFKSFIIYPMGEGALAGLARTVLRTMFMLNASTRQFELVSTEAKAVEAIYTPGGPSREHLRDALRFVTRSID